MAKKNTNLVKLRILITGGAGAVGSSLANNLVAKNGIKVDVLDNLDSGYELNLLKNRNLRFFLGSVLDERMLDYLSSRDYDYIFHFAARFANQTSVEFPKTDFDVNSTGTLKMLEFASQQKKLKKFVYSSSSCVYGSTENQVMNEDDKLKPDTPYAISKLSAEHYVDFFRRHYQVPANSLRLFNIYGSNEWPGKYRNVIPNFVHLALNNQDITVMGDGSDTRDFTYIDDALEMMLGVAFDDANNGETYNIGSGIETRIIDLAEAVIKGTGSKSQIVFIPKRDWDTISRRRACIKKISQYKNGKHCRLEKGLKTVFNFVDTLQPLINS